MTDIPETLDDLTDDEIDRIHEEGAEAGEVATTFHYAPNPYPHGSAAADIWAHAFRNAYARSIDR